MTKEEFLQLQELQRNSGLPLMKYLDKVGLKYSTYTYRMLTYQAHCPTQATIAQQRNIVTCIGSIFLFHHCLKKSAKTKIMIYNHSANKEKAKLPT